MELNLKWVANDPTKKEVLASIIGELREQVISEWSIATDEEKKKELAEKASLLRYEAIAVLKDDIVAHSIQDKVIRLYSPQLKSYNESRRSEKAI